MNYIQNFLSCDKVKENNFSIFNASCLEFLNKEYILQLFINCEDFVCLLIPPFVQKHNRWSM